LKNAEQDWLKTNLARFSRMLQGERDLTTVSNLIMSELAPLVNAQYGVFYITAREADDTVLELAASYGAEIVEELKPRFHLREGLVGQAAADKRTILLENAPSEFVRIGSGLGHSAPTNIAIMPALFEDEVKAVIELASFSQFNETHQSFLDQLMESIGIVLNTIAATMRTEGLLKQSQLLTQELQARQTELTTKQEELHATNEELQEKALLLQYEKKQVEEKNLEIDMARRAIEEKAEQLALTSKYKSEFLANMSHELRTPLNSLLILSKLLSDNPQGNLNEKQIEFAKTIHSAGSDLLNLINDILDLSKIESGTVTIDVGDVPLKVIKQNVERTFRQIAADKGLKFEVDFDDQLPLSMNTDEKRLQQVVLNLLSNAFKFTSEGSVTLSARCASEGWSKNHPVLSNAKGVIAFAVTDTGIGIPEDKQRLIFEAFQQADGTTSRRYGGTGLGLSISREIARLLGGELQVQSSPGKGSTFTLFVPQDCSLASDGDSRPPIARIAHDAEAEGDAVTTLPAVSLSLIDTQIADDRDRIGDDPFLLIVEDDPTFASILLDLAHEVGLKGVVSTAGAGTLAMARRFQPDAITLDLGLSDIDGFVLLDLLKHDPQTRHIPVHVISGKEDLSSALSLGAVGVTEKPAAHEALLEAFNNVHQRISRTERNVLLIASDKRQRRTMMKALEEQPVKVVEARSVVDASTEEEIDCFDVILAGEADVVQTATELATLSTANPAPFIVFSRETEGPELRTATNRLSAVRDVIVAHSGDELSAMLSSTLRGRREHNSESGGQRIVPELSGATILIVDDDIRNIYSLTSVLESYDAKVLHAERGREGIKLLQQNSDIDVALIDIMMPEMDGYETMRQIRSQPALSNIPLIAVTAKAMKGDRQKCLDAGASDYIAKPVDMDLLLALLRVWIGRARDRTGTGRASAEQALAD
jgi:signal transduction histidine kinase/CheY-like chemotaxis protein